MQACIRKAALRWVGVALRSELEYVPEDSRALRWAIVAWSKDGGRRNNT
jgi:hypothetical protein